MLADLACGVSSDLLLSCGLFSQGACPHETTLPAQAQQYETAVVVADDRVHCLLYLGSVDLMGCAAHWWAAFWLSVGICTSMGLWLD